MTEITYIVEAKGPLALNARKPGGTQYQESYEVIPGSVVRGTLAALLLPTCQDNLGEHNHDSCPQPALCRAIFGNQARFRNAIPTGQESAYHSLLPATAMNCKNSSGFANKPEPVSDDDHHGIFDTLIDRTVWESLLPDAMQYFLACPTCGGRTTAARGAYSIDGLPSNVEAGERDAEERDARERGTGAGIYTKRSVARELFTRVAINRRRAVAEDELLYSVSAITERTLSPLASDRDTKMSAADRFPPTCFVGSIWVPDEDSSTELYGQLTESLKKIRHVGSGRTRGLGRVAIKTVDTRRATALEERLDLFNRCFTERSALWGAGPPQTSYFSIALQSDAILSLDGWAPTMRLEPELLWRACGQSGSHPDLKLIRTYAMPITRGGWNGIYGLRKETATCAQAGSVYLFATDAQSDWIQHLADIENLGVGERRVEGYGQITVCDDIHTLACGSVL